MAKQLTDQEIQKIKDSVIASCVSKGIKPTVSTANGVVSNPLYTQCVQLGYEDAVKHATEGKLGLWFSKVNSFVQSQGGFTGLLQSVASIAGKYNDKTANMPANMYGSTTGAQYPVGYNQLGTTKKSDNMGLWLFLVILLIVLIIATAIYFHKKSKTSAA